MARKRDHITKGTRFSIFARDGFQCQYCGRLVPEVVLHLDHITPHSQGGSDDPGNLITSCEACNIGKGAKTVAVQREVQASVEHLTERREQIAAYHEYQRGLEEQLALETEHAIQYWANNKTLTFEERAAWARGEKVNVTVPDRASLRRFIRLFGYSRIVEAMDIALSRYHTRPESYLFGILHNWRRTMEGDNGKSTD